MQCGVGPQAILLIIGPPYIHLNVTGAGAGADHTPHITEGAGRTRDLAHHTADLLLAGGTAPILLTTADITHLMMVTIGGDITDPSLAAFPQVKVGAQGAVPGKGGARGVIHQVSLPGQGGVPGGVIPGAFHLGLKQLLGGVIPAAFHLHLGDQGGAHPENPTQAAAEAPVPGRCQGLLRPHRLPNEQDIECNTVTSVERPLEYGADFSCILNRVCASADLQPDQLSHSSRCYFALEFT